MGMEEKRLRATEACLGRASILYRGSDFVPHTWGGPWKSLCCGSHCQIVLENDLENDCKRMRKNEVSVHSKKVHTNPR